MPLTAAVAAVHQAGLRLPGLSAADVLVAASGRPLLDGFALLRGPVGGSPEDDVRALVGLLLARLSDADGPLHDLLGSVTAQPPSAVELQRRLARLGPAEPLPVADRPVRGRGRAAAAVSGRRRRSRPRRFTRPLVLLVAVAGLAVAAGTAWARLAAPDAAAVLAATPAEAPAGVAAEPAAEPLVEPAAVDWTAVLRAADAARGRAFATGDPGPLEAADVPGSAAEVRDRQAVDALRRNAVVARGWTPLVHAVEVLGVDAQAAVLRVVDELPPWELVDIAGRVVQRFPARARSAWQVELSWVVDAGWRVVDARPDAGVR